MTSEKLSQANELSKQIADLEKIIENGKSQKCEWIEFTFGNGSNKANVCNDKGIIEAIRSIIVKENEQKLAKLRIEFSEL